MNKNQENLVMLIHEVWLATEKVGQIPKWHLLASDAIHFLVFCKEIKEHGALLANIMYLREYGGIKFVGGEKAGGLVIRELPKREGGTWKDGEYDKQKSLLSDYIQIVKEALTKTEQIVGRAPEYVPNMLEIPREKAKSIVSTLAIPA